MWTEAMLIVGRWGPLSWVALIMVLVVSFRHVIACNSFVGKFALKTSTEGPPHLPQQDSISPRNRPRIARYYRGARTVHLERLVDMQSGDFLYGKPMYDFDSALADSLPQVSRLKFRTVMWRVIRLRYDVLELAEPYTPSALPQNLALAAATRLTGLVLRRQTKLVTYAIENSDLSEKLAAKLRVPVFILKPIVRTLVGYCYRRFDRIVFGTSAAFDNYGDLLGTRAIDRARPTHTLIWGLPTAHPDLGPDQLNPELIFLGAFDLRKGLTELMSVWDAVIDQVPTARLTVIGKGPLGTQVQKWASTRSSVTVVVDPSREVIRGSLAGAKALFLLSQPSRLWKEQIGLPIVEGLSFGLEIVASTETGISRWLKENRHVVLTPNASETLLVAGVVAALRSRRSRADIVESLPPRDGRLEADWWLFSAYGCETQPG